MVEGLGDIVWLRLYFSRLFCECLGSFRIIEFILFFYGIGEGDDGGFYCK